MIKNLLIVNEKGRPSNKRIASATELIKKKKEKKKIKN